jgi:hypothetical protein
MGQPSPANTQQYDMRDLPRITATFTSTDLVTPADPSSIYCFIRTPYGSVATYGFPTLGGTITFGGSIIRATVGGYFVEFTPSLSGEWFYRWEASGGIIAAEEWQMIVSDSKFTL